MNGPGDGFDPIGEDVRVERLEERLDRVQARETERLGVTKPVESDASYRAGNNVLGLLLGGLIGGAGIGWVIDQVAGTKPWGLLICLLLGIVGAFWQIIKSSSVKR